MSSMPANQGGRTGTGQNLSPSPELWICRFSSSRSAESRKPFSLFGLPAHKAGPRIIAMTGKTLVMPRDPQRKSHCKSFPLCLHIRDPENSCPTLKFPGIQRALTKPGIREIRMKSVQASVPDGTMHFLGRFLLHIS